MEEKMRSNIGKSAEDSSNNNKLLYDTGEIDLDTINALIAKLYESEDDCEDINLYVSFEPFSFLLMQELKKLKNRIERNQLYNDILNHPNAAVLNKSELAKTTLLPKHNTNDDYWKYTKEMAIALNEEGVNICFLPESGAPQKTQTADSILNYNGSWMIADFKYFHSSNINTLAKDLKNGFGQASTIVLKIVNADLGILREAIDYLKRNNCKIGDMFIMNEYNKFKFVTKNNLKTDKYLKLLKGFL